MSSAAAGTRTGAADALGLALVIAFAASLLALGWGNAAHPLIDFGRELYVAWRLAEGERLYADLAYFNGPLSPYLNALFFRVFGAGLTTLLVCNLVVAGVLLSALYVLLLRAGDRYSATLAGLVFVGLFALAQIDDIGNDTYLSPYSHEITHGLTLAALALLCLSWAPRRPVAGGFGSGLFVGLVFLTKPEIFLATAVAQAAGLVALSLGERHRGARAGGALLAGLLLGPLFALGLLSSGLPPDAALRGVLGAWPSVFDGELTSQHFYRLTLGTLHAGPNLLRGLAWTLGYLAVLVPTTTLALRVASASRHTELCRALAAGLVVFGGALLLPVNWVEVVRPLPVLLSLLLAALVLAWRRAMREGSHTEVLALRIVLVVFSLALLAKVALAVHLMQYGFALAMPGTLLLVLALSCWLPAEVLRRGGSPWLLRGAATGFFAALLATLGLLAHATAGSRDVELGRGPDQFRAAAGSRLARSVLAEVERRLEPGETLAVLPEGVMLNYLSRRRTPTRHLNFMPPELIIFGERSIVSDFAANPPDYVVLLQRNVREYGFEAFGRGYGEELRAWIEANYRRVWRLPAPEGRRGSAALLLEYAPPEED